MGSLFAELKRRKVFRVAAVYAVVAWLLIQVADTVMPALQMPEWTVSFVTILLILGFIPTIIAAWAYEITPEGIRPEDSSSSPPGNHVTTAQPINYAILAIVVVMAIVQIADRFIASEPAVELAEGPIQQEQARPPVFRTNFYLPWSMPRIAQGIRGMLDITQDGSKVHFLRFELTPGNTGSIPHQTIVDLNSGAISTLRSGPGTGMPVISPDGRNVLLVNPFEIAVMDADGSNYRQVSPTATPVGWYSNSEIMVMQPDGDLVLTSESGSVIRSIGMIDSTEGIVNFGILKRIPDTNQILYGSEAGINTLDLNTGETRNHVRNAHSPSYLETGHLVFAREADLWAVPYDLDSNEVIGEETFLVSEVDEAFGAALPPGTNFSSYAVSATGRLIYLQQAQARGGASSLLAYWSVEDGGRQELNAPDLGYKNPQVSPDGTRIAVSVFDGEGASDVWVFDIASENLARRTFSGRASRPIWSADSSKLYYLESDDPVASRRGNIGLVNADGTGQAEIIYQGQARPQHEVAGENRLLFLEGPNNGASINSLTFRDGTWVREVLIEEGTHLLSPSVSPDGRWISYAANESGLHRIYVRPYPNVEDGLYQVSSEPSYDPTWSASGDLYFAKYGFDGSDDDQIIKVAVSANESSGALISSLAEIVLDGINIDTTDLANFSISPEGDRVFQALGYANFEDSGSETNATFGIVENWFEEVLAKAR